MDANGLAVRVPIPVRLAWLETEDHAVEGSLADAVGDSYLCAHSHLYSSVRQAALRLGFRFSCADTPLWRDYHFLPLTTIDRLLDERVIPYSDNWASLRRMIEANPKASMRIDMLIRQLRHNHSMHEAAHGIAHHLLQGLDDDLDRKHREVVKAILGECFANAVEMTGSDFRHNLLVDELFYSVNSYMPPSEKRAQILRQAAEKWGPAARFAAFLAAYFESNLSSGEECADAVEKVAETSGLERCELLEGIVGAAFKLNKGFREDTTPFYFERRGLAGEYRELMKSGWLGDEDHRRFVRLFLERVWQQIPLATRP